MKTEENEDCTFQKMTQLPSHNRFKYLDRTDVIEIGLQSLTSEEEDYVGRNNIYIPKTSNSYICSWLINTKNYN